MTAADLNEMRARIQRAYGAISSAAGIGYSTSYVADGTDFTTHFRAVGIKAPEQLQDEFLAMFVWVWSLKDYLKDSLKSRGMRGKDVEDAVNDCQSLGYVADIANRVKHGTLRESRSGDFAELRDVGYEVPREAFERIVIAGPEVVLHVNDPNLSTINAKVVTASGMTLDALEVLNEAMHCWENSFLNRISGQSHT